MLGQHPVPHRVASMLACSGLPDGNTGIMGGTEVTLIGFIGSPTFRDSAQMGRPCSRRQGCTISLVKPIRCPQNSLQLLVS